jgi:hypothetical protein
MAHKREYEVNKMVAVTPKRGPICTHTMHLMDVVDIHHYEVSINSIADSVNEIMVN